MRAKRIHGSTTGAPVELAQLSAPNRRPTATLIIIIIIEGSSLHGILISCAGVAYTELWAGCLFSPPDAFDLNCSQLSFHFSPPMRNKNQIVVHIYPIILDILYGAGWATYGHQCFLKTPLIPSSIISIPMQT